MATKLSFNTRGVTFGAKPTTQPAQPQAARVDRPVSVKTTEVKPTEA